ncbi:MAG: hypothetical protein ACLRSW_03545 [Christensenellaceae bacterium]
MKTQHVFRIYLARFIDWYIARNGRVAVMYLGEIVEVGNIGKS